MAIRLHPARYTADTLKMQADFWFPRLTDEERDAIGIVRAALHRIAGEDLAAVPVSPSA